MRGKIGTSQQGIFNFPPINEFFGIDRLVTTAN
jgi:hypothetical protein